jgi:predicted nucleic acid-binding protein
VNVTLDTMTMIWGLRLGGPTPSNAHVADMQRRARILLDELDEDKARIIVPTIVVAELLIGMPATDHGRFITELQKQFFLPTLDLRGAEIAAGLWQKHRTLPTSQQIKRTTLKADVLIIAIAKVAGATAFYSHDAKARKLAEIAGLNGYDLPTHARSLFPPAATGQPIPPP